MRKYKSFTAILLTAALVSSVTACNQNAAQIDNSVEASSDLESTSGISSSGNDIEMTTEAQGTEETMAISEEATEESTTAAEMTETEATAEEQSEAEVQSETEATREEASSEDASEETVKETTTKSSGTTKASETSKAPETTKALETAKTTAAVKPQSIKASVSGTHYVGDTLTGANFTVTVTMSDGSTLTNPAGWSANPLTLSGTSNQITVAYEGVSTTITVKVDERPAATTAAPQTQQTTAAQTATTADPHAGMVYANDGQWHETKAAGEELQAGDVMWFNGEWVVLPEDFGKEKETLIADGDYSYEMARILFDMENEVRIEAGSPPLIWSDELYEVAKQCARVCGDAGEMKHDLTKPYRKYSLVTKSGETVGPYYYAENLNLCGGADIYDEADMLWSAELCIKSIKNSAAHYAALIKNTGSNEEGAVAVFRSGSTLYISYLFHHVDNDLYEIENY